MGTWATRHPASLGGSRPLLAAQPPIHPEVREGQSDHGAARVEMGRPRTFFHQNDQHSITDSIGVGGGPVYIQAADNLKATTKKQHKRNEGSDGMKQ